MVTSFNTLSGAWGAGWKPRATNPTTPDRPVEPKPDQRPDGQSGPPVQASAGIGGKRDRLFASRVTRIKRCHRSRTRPVKSAVFEQLSTKYKLRGIFGQSSLVA